MTLTPGTVAYIARNTPLWASTVFADKRKRCELSPLTHVLVLGERLMNDVEPDTLFSWSWVRVLKTGKEGYVPTSFLLSAF